MAFETWKFPEVFSFVGAVLFAALYGVQISGFYDVTGEIIAVLPESVVDPVPAVVAPEYVLIGIALLAAVGTLLQLSAANTKEIPGDDLDSDSA